MDKIKTYLERANKIRDAIKDMPLASRTAEYFKGSGLKLASAAVQEDQKNRLSVAAALYFAASSELKRFLQMVRKQLSKI